MTTHLPMQLVRLWLMNAEIVSCPVFVGHMPDEPAHVVVVYDDDAMMDGRLMAGEVIEWPYVQIRARGSTPSEARATIMAIKDAVDALLNYTIEEQVIHALHRKSGIVDMGVEPDKRRSNYSLSVLVSLG